MEGHEEASSFQSRWEGFSKGKDCSPRQQRRSQRQAQAGPVDQSDLLPERGRSCLGSDLSVIPKSHDVEPCAFCKRNITPGNAIICNWCGLSFHVVHYRRHRAEWPCGDTDSSDDDPPPGLPVQEQSRLTSRQRSEGCCGVAVLATRRSSSKNSNADAVAAQGRLRAERWSSTGYAVGAALDNYVPREWHEQHSNHSYWEQRWISFARRLLGTKPPVRRGRRTAFNRKANRLVEQATGDFQNAVEAASVPTSEVGCQPCDSVEHRLTA